MAETQQKMEGIDGLAKQIVAEGQVQDTTGLWRRVSKRQKQNFHKHLINILATKIDKKRLAFKQTCSLCKGS